MNVLFKPSWWLQMFLSTLLTMVFMYFIKKLATTYNVPVVSTVAEGI